MLYNLRVICGPGPSGRDYLIVAEAYAGKKTEVDSINGVIVNVGKKFKVDVCLNEILLNAVKTIC